MTRTIILQGKMGELFGKTHKLNVKSIQEAMHALDCLKGGVKRYLMECQDLGIHFTVQKGEAIKEYAQNEELYLDNQNVLNDTLDSESYIITPIPSGSGGKFEELGDRIGKLILAIFMIWIGITFGPGGSKALEAGWAAAVAQGIGYLGASLAIDAITEIMMGDPDDGGEGQTASLFNGPVNTTKPGVPIPIAYGEVEAGGAVINFGFTNSQLTSSHGYTFNAGVPVNNNVAADGGGNYDYSEASVNENTAANASIEPEYA